MSIYLSARLFTRKRGNDERYIDCLAPYRWMMSCTHKYCSNQIELTSEIQRQSDKNRNIEKPQIRYEIVTIFWLHLVLRVSVGNGPMVRVERNESFYLWYEIAYKFDAFDARYHPQQVLLIINYECIHIWSRPNVPFTAKITGQCADFRVPHLLLFVYQYA